MGKIAFFWAKKRRAAVSHLDPFSMSAPDPGQTSKTLPRPLFFSFSFVNPRFVHPKDPFLALFWTPSFFLVLYESLHELTCFFAVLLWILAPLPHFLATACWNRLGILKKREKDPKSGKKLKKTGLRGLIFLLFRWLRALSPKK